MADKFEAAVRAAKAALQAGQQTLVGTNMGNPADWGAAIDAIEAIGWRLEHWAVMPSPTTGRSPFAYPVFRRVR